MCVNRQELRKGTHLVLDKEYKIIEKVGCGASCVVYLAENSTNSRKVLIKELYPMDLGIFRNESNALIIPAGSKEAFEQYKEKLNKSVALQISFHNAEDSGNSTSDAEGIIEANNTLYVVMGRVIGESYDKHTPEDLTSVLKIGRSVAKAIAMYHNKGYLHLDIKAENVFKIKETNELIKLFDFDSVHPKEEIQKGYYYNLSFSEPSAAPEVQNYLSNGLHCIDERADIFSIGALIFKKIMGRGVTRGDLRPYKKWNFDSVDLLKTVSPQAKNVLTIIFRDTLAEDSDKRYHDTEELIIALDKAIELSETKIFLADHNITTTTSKDYYISRADKVKEIRDKLNGYHIAYLYGIGGIGKSETAKEYAEINRNQYDIIHLTHYSIDLKHTVAMLNFINLDDREIKFEEKYQIRLNFLSNKEMYSANTLLIIDNYNVAPDSDEYKKNVEVLKELKKLNIHILFTTRTTPNDGNHRIDIEELSDDDLRALFFAVNSKDETNEDRIAQVNELIEAAYRHTLTVDLVAHQTVQIERFGKKTLADYIAVLKNSGLNNEVKLSVYNNKDDNEKNAIIFDHIKALFDFSTLSQEEEYILVNACLLPYHSFAKDWFIRSIFPSKKEHNDWFEPDSMASLKRKGWLSYDKDTIFLHPIVSEISVSKLKPAITKKKCRKLFNAFVDLASDKSSNFHALTEEESQDSLFFAIIIFDDLSKKFYRTIDIVKSKKIADELWFLYDIIDSIDMNDNADYYSSGAYMQVIVAEGVQFYHHPLRFLSDIDIRFLYRFSYKITRVNPKGKNLLPCIYFLSLNIYNPVCWIYSAKLLFLHYRYKFKTADGHDDKLKSVYEFTGNTGRLIFSRYGFACFANLFWMFLLQCTYLSLWCSFSDVIHSNWYISLVFRVVFFSLVAPTAYNLLLKIICLLKL